jgi:hypothetical protein
MSGQTQIRDGKRNESENLASVTNTNLHTQLTNTQGNSADITSTGSQYVTLQKEDGLNVDVDDTTSALPILEYEHSQIHEGEHYFIDEFIDIANASNYEIILNVPNVAKRIHFVFEYYYEAEGGLELWEGVSTDADGNTYTSFNSDRESSNTSGLVVTHTPTNATTNGATRIVNHRIGSGKGIGGTRRADQEKLLKRNTKYMVRATNYALGASNLFNFQFDWYEKTPDA